MTAGGDAAAAIRLFDALADGYDEHFAVPHRAAYDRLAWEIVEPLLPREQALVVDAGCGVGRWAARLLEHGHAVVGIERAPRMAQAARERCRSARFTVIEEPIESAQLPTGSAAAVIAMGSLQYTDEPAATVARLAGWLRPGGVLAVLVDSLGGLVLELLRRGRVEEARERARSRRGVFRQHGEAAGHHLLDAAALRAALEGAGLRSVRCHGLLVGATAMGVEEVTRRLLSDPQDQLEVERQMAAVPALCDAGKQLLALGSSVA